MQDSKSDSSSGAMGAVTTGGVSLRLLLGGMLLGGFLLGIGLWIGRGLSPNSSSSASRGDLASLLGIQPRYLDAASASDGDKFSLATGAVDEDAEGVFVLDHITGILKCAVLNHRTGKFSALFQANVANDLGVVAKNPHYQMVTGLVNFIRGATLVRPGMSVVYVLDSNAGRIMAYGIPWQREASATGSLQLGMLQPIDILQARTVQVRQQ